MPTSVLENCKTGLCLSAPDIAPASVTSRPSKIQVIPSATTTSVWNRPQGRRSSLAGMSVSRIEPSGRAYADECAADGFSIAKLDSHGSFDEREWPRNCFKRLALASYAPKRFDQCGQNHGHGEHKITSIKICDFSRGESFETWRIAVRRVPCDALSRNQARPAAA